MSVPDPSTTDWVPVWTLGGAPTLADLYANRPAASAAGPGVLFFATDTLGTWRSDGANWTLVAQRAPHVAPSQLAAAPFTTPYDGQEIILVPSSANPYYEWHLRYNAISSNAEKWDFVGGAPLYKDDTSSDNLGSTLNTWIDNTTVTSVPIPRSGLYDVWGYAQFYQPGSASLVQLGIAAGATAPFAPMNAAVVANPTPMYATVPAGTHAMFTAGQDARLRYQQSVASTYVQNRAIRILPVRL